MDLTGNGESDVTDRTDALLEFEDPAVAKFAEISESIVCTNEMQRIIAPIDRIRLKRSPAIRFGTPDTRPRDSEAKNALTPFLHPCRSTRFYSGCQLRRIRTIVFVPVDWYDKPVTRNFIRHLFVREIHFWRMKKHDKRGTIRRRVRTGKYCEVAASWSRDVKSPSKGSWTDFYSKNLIVICTYMIRDIINIIFSQKSTFLINHYFKYA